MGRISGRNDASNVMVSTGPDVCLTPMGSGTVPVAYGVVALLDAAVRLSDSVRQNGRWDFTLNTRSAVIVGSAALRGVPITEAGAIAAELVAAEAAAGDPGGGGAAGPGTMPDAETGPAPDAASAETTSPEASDTPSVPGDGRFSHAKTTSEGVFTQGWSVVRHEDPAWLDHTDVGPVEPKRAMSRYTAPLIRASGSERERENRALRELVRALALDGAQAMALVGAAAGGGLGAAGVAAAARGIAGGR